MADEYDSSHLNARSSRRVTGSKPIAFFILAIGFAIAHHVLNTLLAGQAVDTLMNLDRFQVKVFDHTFPLKNLTQKQQHWVLNLFAFLFKSCVHRAMAYGLSQHAWKALRTTELTVLQIDRVIALQHRKPSGLLSWTLWTECFSLVVYAIITILVPYVAIFPGGSLTVVEVNGTAVYAYNSRWLVIPYVSALVVTFLCIGLGTHHLFTHNKTNLSFAFSHILSATRNAAFDQLLGDADIHHAPAKVLQQLGAVKFGVLREKGREGFARVEELVGEGDGAKDEESG
ncbi:hypothetical protein FPV67DRAFT_1731051 [Lyophyllum atratum]|nr:hypothetical protein FPV67DRAFT_1731051 [Lyophyllum atratum]